LNAAADIESSMLFALFNCVFDCHFKRPELPQIDDAFFTAAALAATATKYPKCMRNAHSHEPPFMVGVHNKHL